MEQNYKLTIAYDGARFFGWERQPGRDTIQGKLESVLSRLQGHPVDVTGAGRTDAGVHATHQVAHLDIDREWRTDVVRDATNARLKRIPVAVLSAELVPDDFDARISARRRYYVYRILDRRAQPALDRDRVWHVPVKLDHEAMDRAAKALLGQHDFTTFRAAQCQANSPVRTIDRLEVTRSGDLIEMRVSAQSFLHNQIRSFAGTLKLAGEGKWTPEDVRSALEARDRKACGPVAPPDGLYFMAVDY